MATVSIEFSVYSDPRYKLLGKLTKTDYFGAIGRTSALWMHCIDRNTQVLSKEIVDAMAGRNGYAQAMVRAELADYVEGDEARVRIKGCEGRIEYLASARERQKKATEAARAAKLKGKSQEGQSDQNEPAPTSESNSDPKLVPTLESNKGTNSPPPLDSSSTSTSASASAFTSASSVPKGLKEADENLSLPFGASGFPFEGSFDPRLNSNLGSALEASFDPTLVPPLVPDFGPRLDPNEAPFSEPSASEQSQIKPPIALFIAAYVKAYQARYGHKTRPDVAGKVRGQISHFLKEVPIERACELISTYCRMSDPWFLKKGHDFITFKENLNRVSVLLDTGNDPLLMQGFDKSKTLAQQNDEVFARALAQTGQNHAPH